MSERYLVRIDQGPWKEVKRDEYEKHLVGCGIEFDKGKSLKGKTFQNGYLNGKVSVKQDTSEKKDPKPVKKKASPKTSSPK